MVPYHTKIYLFYFDFYIKVWFLFFRSVVIIKKWIYFIYVKHIISCHQKHFTHCKLQALSELKYHNFSQILFYKISKKVLKSLPPTLKNVWLGYSWVVLVLLHQSPKIQSRKTSSSFGETPVPVCSCGEGALLVARVL